MSIFKKLEKKLRQNYVEEITKNEQKSIKWNQENTAKKT